MIFVEKGFVTLIAHCSASLAGPAGPSWRLRLTIVTAGADQGENVNKSKIESAIYAIFLQNSYDF